MLRRTFLASAASGPFFAFAKNSHTNLLFLCSDQHQTDAAGCYGSAEVHTPHIDEIASNGARFGRVYCQAPVCVPSRGSIITGVYPHAHGARILRDPLPNDVRTIAHFFQDQGYATGAIGKMHFVDETRRHGFEHRLYHADFLSRLTKEEQQRIREDQGGAGDVIGKPSKLPARLFRDTYYADETIRFLRENKDRPFCLWSSYFMPHTPLVPLRRFYELYDPEKLTLPKRPEDALKSGFEGHLIRARERGWYQQTEPELRRALAGYYGNISQVDWSVGRVYDTLRELGLEENTVVVYTSDHGEMAGAHRMWTKHNMYEESVRVPLIVSQPGRSHSGAAKQEIVEQADLVPTLIELCGFSAPKGLHGRSFAPLLRNETYTQREFAYSEYYFCHNVFTRDNRYVGKPPILMVRTDRWKFNYLSWERSELFDLEKDPGEHHNVIDDSGNQGIVKELTAIAQRMYRA